MDEFAYLEVVVLDIVLHVVPEIDLFVKKTTKMNDTTFTTSIFVQAMNLARPLIN